jgi:hypothetical protein
MLPKNGLFNKCKMTEVNFAMCDKFILKFILKSVFWISQILYVKDERNYIHWQ